LPNMRCVIQKLGSIESFLQLRNCLVIAAGMMKKQPCSALSSRNTFQLDGLRALGNRFVVSAQIRQDVGISEMGHRGIRIQSNRALGLSFAALPIPVVPNQTKREGRM